MFYTGRIDQVSEYLLIQLFEHTVTCSNPLHFLKSFFEQLYKCGRFSFILKSVYSKLLPRIPTVYW